MLVKVEKINICAILKSEIPKMCNQQNKNPVLLGEKIIVPVGKGGKFMKKYLSLFLVAIVVLVILVSCGESQDAISSSDGTKDSIDGVGGSDLTDVSSNKGGATVGSSDTSKDETTTGSSDTSKDETTTGSSDTSEDEITTGSTDTSMGGTTEDSIEPPKEDEPQDPKDPTEKVNTVTWQFNYDYGDWIITPAPSYEPRADLLVDYGNLGRGFDGVVIPDDIVAGDTITIEYTGEITILESYPARIQLDGEVKSYSFGYAEVTHYEGEDFSIEHIKACYDYKDAYVILDRSGRYVKLDEYTGNEIYLVTDQKKLYGDDLGGIQDLKAPLKHPIACMLAYNPRGLEDGVPDYEYISENVAAKIAYNHYYNTYFLTCEEDFEYEISRSENLKGVWEIRITEYGEKGYTYCYTIDENTGEIISLAIDDE